MVVFSDIDIRNSSVTSVWCTESLQRTKTGEMLNTELNIKKSTASKMTGNVWKSSYKLGRLSTHRSSEIAQVIVLSLLLAVLFQIPMAAFHSRVSIKSDDSFIRSVGPEAAVESATEAPEINSVEQSRAVQQQAFQPTSIPHYSFIKFSSYRVSLKTFYVVGITSQVVREYDQNKIVHSCEWHPASNGSQAKAMHTDPRDFVVANASMLYIRFDENGMTYVPAIVNCTFNEDVGADGNGGLLVIRVSLTYHRWEKNVPAIVHDEHKGDVEFFISPPKEKPHKYAFCGPPMHGHVKADWLKAWLVYHNYLWNGDAHFFFYNVGGLMDDDRHHFKDFIDAGLLNITDLTNPYIQSLYPSWYYHQLLYINDCLQRAQFLADYIFFFDFDEFLQIRAPEAIGSLLDKHKELPWLTVGNIPADFDHCTPPAATSGSLQYPVERMLWRDKLPECMHDDEDPWTCIASVGRRKWVANTKYTILGGVHRAALPFEGGINMNASEARVIHFHGVLNPYNTLCNTQVEKKDYASLGHMERDDAISLDFARAKVFPIKRKAIAKSHR